MSPLLPRFTPILLLSTCLLLLSSPGCDDSLSPERREAAKKAGEAIISLIDDFHSKHGRYPQSLDEAATQAFLDAHPPNAGSNRWEYRLIDSTDTYYLMVFDPTNRGRYLDFDSKSRKWGFNN